MERPLPVFGTKLPGSSYRPRPGAYAVVFDAQGRVALVHEEGDWYLPGGGIEAGETSIEALVREVFEECACGVQVGEPFAEALEFVQNRSGERFEVHGHYFRAEFVGTPTVSWLSPDEARARTRRRNDAWAISAALPRSQALASAALPRSSSPNSSPTTRFLDLSHTIHHGLVTYPGLPAPTIAEHLDRASSRAHYAPGTEFSIGRMELVANTGTYLDAPFHRYASGKDLAALELASLADLTGVVVRAPRGVRALGPELFQALELAGRAVLIDTGWSRHFGTPAYGSGHPFLTRAAAEHLVAGGATLVGIDSLNIDDTASGERPVHSLLLERDVRIVEHLTNLASLPPQGFRFFAVPVKVRGMGSFPVRAFALLDG
ncbi:MAG: NUDIX domain-containing protein [Planctomycetes bacterium]|nr:NUDIX domain-containing protein [Planctomycetota bacterium]